jgi:HSP20 family molecular chaperone IbpA
MAVAGFGEEDVEIEVKGNTPSIRGEKKEADTERTFLQVRLRRETGEK